MNHPPPTPPIHCPRCDYDLSGEVARWNHDSSDSCPTTGTCTECGLDLEWRLILNPKLAGQPWFVETPRQWSWSAALRTARAAFRPWRFWSQIKLEFPLRRERMALFLIALLVLPLLCRGLLGVAEDIVRGNASLSNFQSILNALWQSFSELRYRIVTTRYGPSFWTLATPALIFGMPIMFLLLPWTRARSKVRAGHVLRIAVYSFVWAIFFVWWSLILKCISLAMVFLNLYWIGKPAVPRWRDDDPWYQALDPFTLSTTRPWFYTFPVLDFLVTCAIILFVLVYWWFALSRGMRMKDHRAAFIAISIPTLLAAFLCMAFNPGFVL